jgi:hypothetical protein
LVPAGDGVVPVSCTRPRGCAERDSRRCASTTC